VQIFIPMIAQAVRKHRAFGDATDPRDPGDDVLSPSSLCVCDTSNFRDPLPPGLPRYKRDLATVPLVSVVCPTSTDRHWSHLNLYRSFQSQTWPNKELVIVDSGEVPSQFFHSLQDDRVRYFHIALTSNLATTLDSLREFIDVSSAFDMGDDSPWQAAHRAWEMASNGRSWYELEDIGNDSSEYLELVASVVTLGGKRNFLTAKARGEVLANFDDDDIYLPSYLARMVTTLLAHDAALVKLSSFFHFHMIKRTLYISDVDAVVPISHQREHLPHPDRGAVHGMRWGYGFCFVYRRTLALRCPYGAVNFGEDYALVISAAQSGKRCLCFKSLAGDATVLHVSHHGNSSSVPFQMRLMALDEAGAREFDATFASPCLSLVRALGAEFAVHLMQPEAYSVSLTAEARPVLEAGGCKQPTAWMNSKDSKAPNWSLLMARGLREEASVTRARRHAASATNLANSQQ